MKNIVTEAENFGKIYSDDSAILVDQGTISGCLLIFSFRRFLRDVCAPIRTYRESALGKAVGEGRGKHPSSTN